jgi:hypothetical protein
MIGGDVQESVSSHLLNNTALAQRGNYGKLDLA